MTLDVEDFAAARALLDAASRRMRHDARIELPDDGFAARVIGVLPARAAPQARAWLRPALVMGSALLGCALAVTLSPQAASLMQGF